MKNKKIINYMITCTNTNIFICMYKINILYTSAISFGMIFAEETSISGIFTMKNFVTVINFLEIRLFALVGSKNKKKNETKCGSISYIFYSDECVCEG